jgi:hypothetical protein
MIEIDDYFECSSHSDERVYGAVCKSVDEHICDGSSTQSNLQFPVTCRDLEWCDYFCGEACDEGSGGICMLNLVSNMRTTCERISSHVEQLYGDPALNDGSHRLHLTSASSTTGSTTTITTIKPSVEGCGNYFICGWCKGDCLISVVQEYFFNVFNDEIPSDRPMISPAVNVKYSLFVQPVEMCDTFGMLSSKAELFKGMRPGEGKELVTSSSSSSSSSSYFHEPGMFARVSSVLIMLPAIVVTLMLLVRYLFRRRIIIAATAGSQMNHDNNDSSSINGGSSGSKYMGVFSSSDDDDDIDDTSTTFKFCMEERKYNNVKQYSNF